MKQLLTFVFFVAIAALVFLPGQVLAAGDTLDVSASGLPLDQVVANDAGAHHAFRLISTDTTYIYDAAIAATGNIAFIGVPASGSKKLPCIQPDVVGGAIPGTLFSETGNNANVTFKNIYLLGLSINNSPEFITGTAIQISANNVRLVIDNCVFEEWMGFAIGYNGSMDKFIVTNTKFRNMVHPNQWYVGEVLRNEYPGSVPTDSIIFQGNTIFCINGYASAPVTKFYVTYFDFSHNSVVYTFKNPFFIFNVTNAKINNNIFYCNYAGGMNRTEHPWWDELWSPEIGSVIDMDNLDLAKDSVFDPADVGNANLPALAEAKRNVEVLNNVYFWPSTMTSYWTAWDDTANVDTIYTPSWMNGRTTNMFTDKTHWPGFNATGNLNVDPAYGATIPGVLTQAKNGLLDWWALCRRGTLSNTYWDYAKTQVDTLNPLGWTPTWPLPESADMQYTNTPLKTGGTDGLPIGDPNWFGTPMGVSNSPAGVVREFSLAQNYPNPFNPSTRIEFSLAATSQVSLKVFNVLGQEVATVAQGTMNSGAHVVTFDASRLSTGVYFYKLVAGNYTSTRKMLLMK